MVRYLIKMKQLSDYNLHLTKWKLPYFKKYVRGEITYKEYAPSVSEMAKIIKDLVPTLYTVAIGQLMLGKLAGGLKDVKKRRSSRDGV